MATEKQSSSSPEVTSGSDLPISSSYTIAESVPLPITGHKLNGNNYLQWSQSIMMYISGKGKDDYLTGEIVSPQAGDPHFRLWKTENNMVMSWLVNSMTSQFHDYRDRGEFLALQHGL